jgi:hypothetical protein
LVGWGAGAAALPVVVSDGAPPALAWVVPLGSGLPDEVIARMPMIRPTIAITASAATPKMILLLLRPGSGEVLGANRSGPTSS